MRRLLTLLILLAVIGGGMYAIYWWHSPVRAATAQVAGQAPGRRGEATVVPVLTAPSQIRDVPIYLDALGTVQAFNPVSVRTMVDGPLVEVRFREGQDVKAGDVLARIDPRSYQAALDSAVAKKQQDEATLANAKLDLTRYAKLVATNYTSSQQADTRARQVAQDEAQVRRTRRRSTRRSTQLSYATIIAPIDGRIGHPPGGQRQHRAPAPTRRR